MTAAAITSGSVEHGSMAGFTSYMCKVTLAADSTDALTIETGLNKIVSCQATWLTADQTTASGLICTASGGQVTIQATTDVDEDTVQLFVLGF